MLSREFIKQVSYIFWIAQGIIFNHLFPTLWPILSRLREVKCLSALGEPV